MTYRIARNGQVYGPYTDAEVARYLASGNILATDLAQVEGTEDWVPVLELFPATAGPQVPPPAAAPFGAAPAAAYPARSLYPDPPDFPWWGVLLLGIFTGGIFVVIWDLVESAWLRRIDKTSRAFLLYLAWAVVFFLRLPSTWHTVTYNVWGGPVYYQRHAAGLGLLGLTLAIVSRFVFRSDLLRHFNVTEPVGLRLNGLWTLLFGGIYFQYHFNRINAVKRALHVSVPG